MEQWKAQTIDFLKSHDRGVRKRFFDDLLYRFVLEMRVDATKKVLRPDARLEGVVEIMHRIIEQQRHYANETMCERPTEDFIDLLASLGKSCSVESEIVTAIWNALVSLRRELALMPN